MNVADLIPALTALKGEGRGDDGDSEDAHGLCSGCYNRGCTAASPAPHTGLHMNPKPYTTVYLHSHCWALAMTYDMAIAYKRLFSLGL